MRAGHQRDKPRDCRVEAWASLTSVGEQRDRDEFSHMTNESINHAYVMKLPKKYDTKTHVSFLVGEHTDTSIGGEREQGVYVPRLHEERTM